ncbi:tripartite tricarboxylate transporter substrate binding protein [Verticiella sediminum]|uniref:Tripartite tricarboxylate transporter substrate binding protein n=1 Tax=Verticiella sediminum TaxID=1247510 RepID=A0A556AZE0_9BURK|nr:tripartite tricarboxylate transporter substrate binding protein [Verticiella sediminum]TSH98303.1 tripartite tricarboxylate transporter substrate binding protein [Verticiella sediminum]
MNAIRYVGMAGLALCLSQPALAENFPDRPVTIVVPFSPGGIVDSVARIVAEPLAKSLGQPVIVENKAGAGGAIGTENVRKAKPDGYTVLAVSASHVVQPMLVASAQWDAKRDFRGLAGAGYVPNLVVVPASGPYRDLPALIEKARSDPGSVTYASAGIGTSNHLSGELLSQLAGVDMTHVPYKGQPDAVTDLLAGRVDMMPLTTAIAAPYVKDGRLRALAVTTREPSSTFPRVPTVAQAASLPAYEVASWFGFVAPRDTPAAATETLSEALRAALDTPAVREKLAGIGMEVTAQDGADLDALIAAETDKWDAVTRAAGIHVAP